MSNQLLEDLLRRERFEKTSGIANTAYSISPISYFEFQLELLKIEIDLVDKAISRAETTTQYVKNFAIVTWAAAIAAFLSQQQLRPFTLLIVTIPVVFWISDAIWLSFVRGSYLRMYKLRDYVNSNDFKESFQKHRLENFKLLDINGRQYRDTKEYKAYAGTIRIMLYREMIFIYGGLTALSIIIGLVALYAF